MALEIDIVAVLRAIAAHQSTFANIRADVSKAQGAFIEKLRSLLVKQLKSSASNLSAAKEFRRALGTDTFDLLVDGMKDPELKAVVSKLDKHNPEQKTASANWRRAHLRGLADGSIEPSAKQTTPKSKKGGSKGGGGGGKARGKKKGAFDFLFDESAGAVRED